MEESFSSKAIPLNDLIYREEHMSCLNNKTDDHSGFQHLMIAAGESADREKLVCNTIVMVLEGRVTINCNEFSDVDVCSGQMLLLPRQVPFNWVAREETECELFRFYSPVSNCDKMIFESLWPLCQQNGYDFSPTPVKPALRKFIDLLVFYHRNGINCIHFHELKHREFFLCLRAFYNREEIAHLLHPLIGKSMTFRDQIIQNSKHVTSVSELIEMSNMGKTRFHARFKQEFGETAKQWLLRQQIKDICYEASRPGILVKELMAKFGFETSSSFTQFCRQHFGCTPTELIGRVRKR